MIDNNYSTGLLPTPSLSVDVAPITPMSMPGMPLAPYTPLLNNPTMSPVMAGGMGRLFGNLAGDAIGTVVKNPYASSAITGALSTMGLNIGTSLASGNNLKNTFQNIDWKGIGASAAGTAGGALGGMAGAAIGGLFGDDETGQIVSTGLSSIGSQFGSTIASNLALGNFGKAAFKGMDWGNIAGVGAQVGGLLLGNAVTDWMGNSATAKQVGKGVGTLVGNSYNLYKAGKGIADATKAVKAATAAGKAASSAAKLGLAANAMNFVGLAASIADSFIPEKLEYAGDYGNVTRGLDTAYDIAQGVVGFIPGVGPIISGAMALGDLTGDALHLAGAYTDGMTLQDSILGSSFFSWTPLGILNGALGKNTNKYTMDKDAYNVVASSYNGSYLNALEGDHKADKRYGLLSRKKYREAAEQVNKAITELGNVSLIANDAKVDRLRAATMNLENYTNVNNKLRGGINLNQVRAAQFGMKIDKAKKTIAEKENIKAKQLEASFNPIWKDEKFSPVWVKEEFTPIWNTKKIKDMTFEDWFKLVPESKNDTINYNLKRAFELAPEKDLNDFIHNENAHLQSVYYNDETGNYEFMKSKNHPTLWMELEYFNNGNEVLDNGEIKPLSGKQREEWEKFKETFELVKPENSDYYQYVRKQNLDKFAKGGKMNVIPEGALHARLHHMENDENITKKGIPVVSEENGLIIQLAEIEVNEIIFTYDVTKKLEELSKENTDEAAIEAGKLLATEIIENTEDRTGLIDTIQ